MEEKIHKNTFKLISLRNAWTKLVLVLTTIFVSSQGVVIHCNFQSVGWVQVDIRYTCLVTEIIDDEVDHVVDIKGNHTELSNKYVQAFSVQEMPGLERIPQKLEDFFSGIVLLLWYAGSLTSITADDLKPFPDLMVLYISHNKLASLDGNLFAHTPRIQRLQLEGNQFEHVGRGLLDDLENLVYVNFEENPCINTLAKTPKEIEELKLKLIAKCPPLNATSTNGSHVEL